MTNPSMDFYDFDEYTKLIRAAEALGDDHLAFVLLAGDAGMRAAAEAGAAAAAPAETEAETGADAAGTTGAALAAELLVRAGASRERNTRRTRPSL